MSETKIPVALQLWSVRDDAANDLAATMAAVAEMGYDGVEFAGVHGHTGPQLAEMLAANKLACAGSHVGIQALQGDKLAETIEWNRAIGNARLVVPCLPSEYTESVDGWKRAADDLNKIAAAIAGESMVLGYHNHAGEFKPVDGEIPHDILFDNLDPAVFMQLDIGWTFSAGVDARDVLRKRAGRATTVHVKEFSAGNETATVGTGDIPWQEVLDVCRSDGGTEWFVVEHERYAAPPMDCVRDCIKYLRGIGV